MLYSILIAADEYSTQRVVDALSKIPEKVYIIGQVQSVAALNDALEASTPDIVILAAALPDGNGLSSIYQLQKRRLGSRIIAFAKEKNFETANMALLCHAEALLFYPLDEELLVSTIRNTVLALDTQLSALFQMKYRKIIGRLFLDQARISQQENQVSAEVANYRYGTHFHDGAYRMAIVCMDSEQDDSPERISQSLEVCAQELFETLSCICYEVVMRFSYKRVHILLNYPPNSAVAVSSLLEEQLKGARKHAAPKLDVALCCSSEYSSVRDINAMAEEAVDALWLRFTHRTAGMLTLEETLECPQYVKNICDRLEEKLKIACCKLDIEAFDQGLDEFFHMPNQVVGRIEARHLMRRVEACLFDMGEKLIPNLDTLSTIKQEVLKTLQMSNSLDEYKKRYTVCLTDLFQRILDNTDDRRARYIKMVKQYVSNNLSSTIRLSDLSTFIGLSTVYLSAFFKQETGCNFSDYVNSCKIEKARQLLADPNMKIQTVASSLAFCDSRYFSRVFKEITGLTPTEYRETTLQGKAMEPFE